MSRERFSNPERVVWWGLAALGGFLLFQYIRDRRTKQSAAGTKDIQNALLAQMGAAQTQAQATASDTALLNSLGIPVNADTLALVEQGHITADGPDAAAEQFLAGDDTSGGDGGGASVDSSGGYVPGANGAGAAPKAPGIPPRMAPPLVKVAKILSIAKMRKKSTTN